MTHSPLLAERQGNGLQSPRTNDIPMVVIVSAKKKEFTTSEVAKLLDVTPGRIRQLLTPSEDKVTGEKRPPEIVSTLFGRDRKIMLDDLMDYLERRGIKPKWERLEDHNSH